MEGANTYSHKNLQPQTPTATGEKSQNKIKGHQVSRLSKEGAERFNPMKGRFWNCSIKSQMTKFFTNPNNSTKDAKETSQD